MIPVMRAKEAHSLGATASDNAGTSGRKDRPPSPQGTGQEPRRQAFIASLKARHAAAEQRQDPEAKQALFKEAAYLGIRPEEYQG
jgi:hypothetical protein